jgi:hypothetical protein
MALRPGLDPQGVLPRDAWPPRPDPARGTHPVRPPVSEMARQVGRGEALEALLREHTWFIKGSTKEAFGNAGTLGEGRLERSFDDATVHELNVSWIAGLKDSPRSRTGCATASSCRVCYEYSAAVKP